MPQVGKKKFSYSKTGKAKAKAYAKKTGFRVKRKKQFMKKGFHKTKDGRTVRKGLYFYANKRRKAGKAPIAKGKKGFVTRASIMRSAKTAKR